MANLASIVIPTFNRAKMLPQAIESALAQTVDCEVIVVDHGSSDNTPEIAADFGDKIRYVRRDYDLGPHFCWLEGALLSSCPLVHLQYDDDWVAPDFIEKTVRFMSDDVGFVFSAAEVIEEASGKRLMLQFADWKPSSGIFDVSEFEEQVLETIVSPGCALFRRSVLIDALYQGRLPLQHAEYNGVGPDIFLGLLSMLRFRKLGYVNEPLATFRAHPGSITIDALSDPEKRRQLKIAYDEVRYYYVELKAMQMVRQRNVA